jgi:hypothetical protein
LRATPLDPLALPLVRNWVYSQHLGWDRRRAEIASILLGFGNQTPDDVAFTQAVARWQLSRGLFPSGVITTATWAVMQPLLP